MSEIVNYKKKNNRKLIEKFVKDNNLLNADISHGKHSDYTREGTVTSTEWTLSFDYNGERKIFTLIHDPFCDHHSMVSTSLANIEEDLDLPVVFGKDGY